jgi:hypothetical protein
MHTYNKYNILSITYSKLSFISSNKTCNKSDILKKLNKDHIKI